MPEPAEQNQAGGGATEPHAAETRMNPVRRNARKFNRRMQRGGPIVRQPQWDRLDCFYHL